MNEIHTSLTGIDETPISSAINQQALESLSGCKHQTDVRENAPEIPPPSKYTLREGIILGKL
jgi:hypothetical protein